MAWGDPIWFFSDVERLLQGLEEASSDDRHVYLRAKEDLAGVPILEGRRVDWLVESNYVVWVPADQIMFTEGNSWNLGHARALYELIQSGERPVLELPACRLYRIDRGRVEGTQRAYEQDELEYQYGMEKPWETRHVGSFFAQLLDGNHRALAAIAAGEEQIPVVVGQNYRGDVKKSEWVKPPKVKARRKRSNMVSRKWREDPTAKLEGLKRLAAHKIEQRRAMGFAPTVDPEDAAQAAMLAELEHRRRGHDPASSATRGYAALEEEIDRSIAPVDLPQTQLREALSPLFGESAGETRRMLRRVDLDEVDVGQMPEERPFFWHEDVVKRAFKILPYRMREIIKLRYGLSGDVYSLRDVAAIFKVSVERVRQLEKLALRRLQNYVTIAQEQEKPRRNPPPCDYESLGWQELDDAHHTIREERVFDELRIIERQGSLKEAMLLFDSMGYDVEGATDWYIEHQPDDFLGEYTRVWFKFPVEGQ